jgi:hypothetical protein
LVADLGHGEGFPRSSSSGTEVPLLREARGQSGQRDLEVAA